MSKWLLVEYPPCSTCQKARRWLQEHGVDFASRHIKEERPSEGELREWAACSGLPLKRFFNTSGLVYRSLGLKDKLSTLTRKSSWPCWLPTACWSSGHCWWGRTPCWWDSARRNGKRQ